MTGIGSLVGIALLAYLWGPLLFIRKGVLAALYLSVAVSATAGIILAYALSPGIGVLLYLGVAGFATRTYRDILGREPDSAAETGNPSPRRENEVSSVYQTPDVVEAPNPPPADETAHVEGDTPADPIDELIPEPEHPHQIWPPPDAFRE